MLSVHVLGTGGVGKSALTLRLVNDGFVEDYDPTIEDSYRKTIVVDGVRTCLTVVDTAGQEEYATMRDHHMKAGEAFLLVYAVDDRNSYEDAKILYEDLLFAKGGAPPPVVLVGNKVDLSGDRQVPKAEASCAARDLFRCPFFEASAKDGTNAHECFFEAVRQAWRHQRAATVRALSEKRKRAKPGCTVV